MPNPARRSPAARTRSAVRLRVRVGQRGPGRPASRAGAPAPVWRSTSASVRGGEGDPRHRAGRVDGVEIDAAIQHERAVGTISTQAGTCAFGARRNMACSAAPAGAGGGTARQALEAQRQRPAQRHVVPPPRTDDGVGGFWSRAATAAFAGGAAGRLPLAQPRAAVVDAAEAQPPRRPRRLVAEAGRRRPSASAPRASAAPSSAVCSASYRSRRVGQPALAFSGLCCSRQTCARAQSRSRVRAPPRPSLRRVPYRWSCGAANKLSAQTSPGPGRGTK